MRSYEQHPAFLRQNARFWVWISSGWVKLTLKPGQRIEYCEGGPHDEGYCYTSMRWELAEDEPVVYRSWREDSRDCDGPYERYGDDRCGVADLQANDMSDNGADCVGIHTPAWGHISSGQRDHYAEAMGY